MKKYLIIFSNSEDKKEEETANVGEEIRPTNGAPPAKLKAQLWEEKEEEKEVQPEPEAQVIESTNEGEEKLVVV